MLNGGPQAGACAQGVPEQVDPIELELVDECGDVIAERLEAEGAIDVAGVAVALQLDRDHPPARRQALEEISEHAGEAEAAVHHDERGAALATALPVHLHTVGARNPC
jgi:hypothetical protein